MPEPCLNDTSTVTLATNAEGALEATVLPAGLIGGSNACNLLSVDTGVAGGTLQALANDWAITGQTISATTGETYDGNAKTFSSTNGPIGADTGTVTITNPSGCHEMRVLWIANGNNDQMSATPGPRQSQAHRLRADVNGTQADAVLQRLDNGTSGQGIVLATGVMSLEGVITIPVGGSATIRAYKEIADVLDGPAPFPQMSGDIGRTRLHWIACSGANTIPGP